MIDSTPLPPSVKADRKGLPADVLSEISALSGARPFAFTMTLFGAWLDRLRRWRCDVSALSVGCRRRHCHRGDAPERARPAGPRASAPARLPRQIWRLDRQSFRRLSAARADGRGLRAGPPRAPSRLFLAGRSRLRSKKRRGVELSEIASGFAPSVPHRSRGTQPRQAGPRQAVVAQERCVRASLS